MFASPALCEQAEELLAAVHEELAPEHLIGAMGEAIVGDGREIEDGPAWPSGPPACRAPR